MSLIEISLLALALSMDAFAVAICIGLTMQKSSFKKALIVGLYFGIFQGVMPLIGYSAATLFADRIAAFDHWIAFGLLGFLGGKMVICSFQKEKCDNKEPTKPEETSVSPKNMLPLAVATSIDAMAVGMSFAFLKVSIVPAVIFIGVTTLVLSMIGVKIGNAFGTRFKSKAELAGGVILILIGLKILLDL
jgi:putative Mn2+ efflux pump MntP